jgi:hypothetical protein
MIQGHWSRLVLQVLYNRVYKFYDGQTKYLLKLLVCYDMLLIQADTNIKLNETDLNKLHMYRESIFFSHLPESKLLFFGHK